ncbi:hypothetical protein AB4Y88_08295, partial [Paenarthrobacter sp. RAF9]
PTPPDDYYDDKYDYSDDGERFTVNDPDTVIVEGGEWKDVVSKPERQGEIISDVFHKLREGVEKNFSPEDGRRWIWLFPYYMNEELDLIKSNGFIDERESRVIVWPNPAWKFVFHRAGPFGLIPYVKLTALGGENADPHETRFATAPGRLPIREIRIGPSPYSVEATSSLTQLLEFYGLHNVKVSCSEIPFRQ